MESLLQVAIKKFVSAFNNLLAISLTHPIGNTAEFEAERKEWLVTSSRISILAEFTKFILYGIPGGKPPVFLSAEVANLKRIFAAHVNRNNCWDQDSLNSCLLTYTPNDKNFQVLLKNCTPCLWKLVTYFSKWPFVNTALFTGTASSSTAPLPFHAWARAVAFLSGRHGKMFKGFQGERDAVVPCRTDRLMLEYLFRALAIDAGQETTTAVAAASSRSVHDDVLDTLNTLQPILNDFTNLMGREHLAPLADRLLPPGDPAPAPLASLTVPTAGPGGILELLALSVFLLQYISQFDKSGIPAILIKDLEVARTELQNADGISFDAFIKWLGDDDLNVYDAMALLFNIFPNPKSLTDGITMNHEMSSPGEDTTFLLFLLRRPRGTLTWEETPGE